MCIVGAVAVDLLVVVACPVLVNVTTTGTSPAPARDAGKVKFTTSKPGILSRDLTRTIPVVLMLVVPTVTVISEVRAPRTPVKVNSTTVGTVLVPSLDVTLNGGSRRCFGLVTLTARALPPGPFAVVKMSG